MIDTTSTQTLVLSHLVGNEPAHLTGLQTFMALHLGSIEFILWIVWVAVLLFMMRQLILHGRK